MHGTPKCSDCRCPRPSLEPRCPHCGRPSDFPNVVEAGGATEREALASRYETARNQAKKARRARVFNRFERIVRTSHAVINRSIHEAYRLATDDKELLATFYQLTNVRFSTSEDPWSRVRRTTDAALFGGYEHELRFAALTIDNRGPKNYGACGMHLREEMIAHRASLLECNSCLWMERQFKRWASVTSLPRGYRAVWDDRARLAVTKVSAKLESAMSEEDFSSLLLSNGETSGTDEMIEVQIFGPLTIRSVERVVVETAGVAEQGLLPGLQENLLRVGVEFVERGR